MAIDPNRETAYRYSATPLMKQQKYDQARDRYIESVITEPYNEMSYRGINQWAAATGAKLANPQIEVPTVTFDDKGKAVPTTAIKADDPSSSPWLAYLTARESWKREKFAKAFPKETAYRHSMAEETDGLRAAVKAADDQKSPNKQFDLLAKINSEGLLEPFVLIVLSDKEIAKDHPIYLKDNRPKLRQFILNYVIGK